MDGGLLAKFDADAEYLEEDMDFSFDDWEILLCSWKSLDTRVDTYYDKVMEGGDNESIGIN